VYWRVWSRSVRRAVHDPLSPVPWVEVFAVFIVSHLAGDFLLQTEWQATNKAGGLGGDPARRRALLSHVCTYTLAFVPALIWLAGEIGAWAVAIGALIAVPHLIQDDGRLLAVYMRQVKHADGQANPSVAAAADQAFHFLALFLTALLATS
jgi:type IV secretory pathway TrbD component